MLEFENLKIRKLENEGSKGSSYPEIAKWRELTVNQHENAFPFTYLQIFKFSNCAYPSNNLTPQFHRALYLCFMFRLIFEFFLIYMVYKLIVDFIIPVYRATRQMKNAMHKAQEQMKNQQFNNTNGTSQKTEPQVKKDFDYIDYEEVK